MAKSERTKEDREKLMQETDETLGMFNMKIKGYTLSGQDPPEPCTKDGVSITTIGYRWYPKLDLICINMAPIHFEEETRSSRSGNKVFLALARGKLCPWKSLFRKS